MTSALQVIFNVMRSINARFTYLLYLQFGTLDLGVEKGREEPFMAPALIMQGS